jgi:DNA-binding IclR family transcriptional regulator
VGTYPVQVLSVTIGHKQPLGVGAAGLALLANLPKNDIEQILHANKNILPTFGGMTCEQMEQLIRSTLERGWSAVGNAAVPGVLGVGVPILHRSGHPIFAISVSSVIDRMPLARQRFIVELIKKELALAIV